MPGGAWRRIAFKDNVCVLISDLYHYMNPQQDKLHGRRIEAYQQEETLGLVR